MKYSASTRGFYSPKIHGDNIPSDAVDVSDKDYRALLSAQSSGQRITPDVNGCPIAQDYTQPDPSIEVNAKLNAVRAVREAMLNRMAGIALVAQIDGDTVTVDAYKAARLALLNITTGHPTDPALVDEFIMLRYLAIRVALPASLITAFAGVDA